jgi:hypothetical protein
MFVPTCRETLRAEKNDKYFDFKQLKLYAHIKGSYTFIDVILRGYS